MLDKNIINSEVVEELAVRPMHLHVPIAIRIVLRNSFLTMLMTTSAKMMSFLILEFITEMVSILYFVSISTKNVIFVVNL